MSLHSAIYLGPVIHERLRPSRHRLRYNVFTLLLDLDELSELDRKHRLLAYNRSGIISFYDADHGSATGEPLRAWVEERLSDAGIVPDGGAIRLLCYPRILGYVFNPLSVYFCYRRDGMLVAILYEVCNTFHESHTYIIPVTENGRKVVRQRCSKKLYVSPFIDMDAEYRFRIVPPGNEVKIAIREENKDGLFFAAAFNGIRIGLTRGAVLRCLIKFPFLGIKVISGIHWEALKMRIKGFSVFRHSPASARVQSSVGRVERESR